jgi:hypothetical protein
LNSPTVLAMAKAEPVKIPQIAWPLLESTVLKKAAVKCQYCESVHLIGKRTIKEADDDKDDK